MQANEILDFWFCEIEKRLWFQKEATFDQRIRGRYASWHAAASKGELAAWRVDISGRLAEIILLHQFSRNLYRDSAQAFACDGMALVLAQEAVATGQAGQLEPERRGFLYMPYMHSESPLIHQQALALFTELNQAESLRFELKHKEIIDRFGRYPHRNVILGRESTEEERGFLMQPGSGF